MNSLTELLFIDTSMEYELDMTRFPGWEDPVVRAQPKLLIHQPGHCMCDNTEQGLYDLIESSSNIFSDCTDTVFTTDYLAAVVPDVESSWEAQLPPIESSWEAQLPPIESSWEAQLPPIESSWEAQLPPISIPTVTPQDNFNMSSCVNCVCTSKRKFSCLEELDDCDNEDALPHKKIHLDTDELLDFLYTFVEHNFWDLAASCAIGDLCRGS